MKIKWNKKYTTIAVYSLIVIMLAVLFVVFVFKFDSFKSGFSWIGSVSAPLICGIVIAYIVNPLMMWIERTFFHKLVHSPHSLDCRWCSSADTYNMVGNHIPAVEQCCPAPSPALDCQSVPDDRKRALPPVSRSMYAQ